MPESLLNPELGDIGLDLAIIGKIGLGFIEEPFDVFIEGRLSYTVKKAPECLKRSGALYLLR